MNTPWLEVLATLTAIVLPLLVAWMLIARSTRIADENSHAKMKL